MNASSQPGFQPTVIPRHTPVAPSPAGDAYAARLARAIALLCAAVGAHVWLVRAPHDASPLGAQPTLVMADAGVAPAALVPADAATRGPARPADFVRIRVDTMRAPITGGFVDAAYRPADGRYIPERHGDNRAATPVGTIGIVRAALDTSEPSSVPQLETAGLAPLPVPERDLANALPVSVPRASTPLPYISPAARAPLVVPPSAPRLDSTAANRAATASMTTAAQDDLIEQEWIVRRILGEYTRAFERLDVRAAKAVWPSLDDRALQRAFEQLDGQQLRFASCGVSITGPDANARCRGNATYRPKVGTRVLHLNEREWTFNLFRGEDGWQIVNARMQ
jgi:hypothetical protein